MQIEKALINDHLRVSKVSWKFRIPTIYDFAILYPWNLQFSQKEVYFLTVSIVFSVYKQKFTVNNLKLEQLWMREFQCFLFVLKWSYIFYNMICMTVPLKSTDTFPNLILQTDSKNEWLLLAASFMAKFELVFVLTMENAFS